MSPKEAAQKLKDALSNAPKVTVRNGQVEVEKADGQKEEATEIQKHKFARI